MSIAPTVMTSFAVPGIVIVTSSSM